MIIAIDGPAASGKGTIARRLGQAYGLPHLDTGLLYRATARAVLDEGGSLADTRAAVAAARGLGLALFDDARLRGKDMGEAASIVAADPAVRAALIDYQRTFAAQRSGAVLDGRDIGTVICPHADIKIFVVASVETRARRRTLELSRSGEDVDPEAVLADIRRRDDRDRGRSEAPLKRAPDAVVLDTEALDIESAVATAMALVADKVPGATLVKAYRA